MERQSPTGDRGQRWGGVSGEGSVFSVTTTGVEKLLHSFGGTSDGVQPWAGLIDVKGTLYGTTLSGGTNGWGTVFSVTTSGKETVRYSFKGSTKNDGQNPYAALIYVNYVNGKLYGTTTGGGFCRSASQGCGTVFATTLSGKESVFYSFKGDDGDLPEAALLNINGTLYGTTEYGGGNYDDGTVFEILPSGKERVLHSFAPASFGDGQSPYAGLIKVKDALYGTTTFGGSGHCGSSGSSGGCGTVFSITP